MPSYAHLFEDGRGMDLAVYLRESGGPAMGDVLEQAGSWSAVSDAIDSNDRELFAAHCAVCHGADGLGNGRLAGNFIRPPANLVTGPFIWTGPGEDVVLRTARVIKFGIVGTDMPGHEVMTDAQVGALVAEVLQLRKK